MKTLIVAAVAVVTALSVTGCSYEGLNSLALPGVVGTGSDSYQVTVKLDSADNLVANVPVMVDDVNVGTVTKVALENWTPTLTLSLGKDVKLPANAVAKLAQTSVLGSKHIELSAPLGEPGKGALSAGALIPETRSQRYPQTEDVLSGVSLLLNGGGLQNAQTITTELNDLFGGRERDVRGFLTQVNAFTTGLDRQKGDIISALHGLDRLGSTLAPQTATIETALDTLPKGLATLQEQEPALNRALQSLGHAGDSIQPLGGEGSEHLGHVLTELEPALRKTADAGQDNVMKALNYVPFGVFALPTVPTVFRGDAINATITFDFTNETLDKNFLGGTPAAGTLGRLDRFLHDPAHQAANPLLPSLGKRKGDKPGHHPSSKGAPSALPQLPTPGNPKSDGLVPPLTPKIGG